LGWWKIAHHAEGVIEMQPTKHTDHTDGFIAQGRALVWAIEVLDTVQPSRPFEIELAQLLRDACKRCLRDIVAEAPSWAGAEILSASHVDRLEGWQDQTEDSESPWLPIWPLVDGDPTSGLESGKALGTNGKALAVSDLEIDSTDPGSIADLQQDPPITKRGGRRETRTLPI
jgi:hypothetical protein